MWYFRTKEIEDEYMKYMFLKLCLILGMYEKEGEKEEKDGITKRV